MLRFSPLKYKNNRYDRESDCDSCTVPKVKPFAKFYNKYPVNNIKPNCVFVPNVSVRNPFEKLLAILRYGHRTDPDFIFLKSITNKIREFDYWVLSTDRGVLMGTKEGLFNQVIWRVRQTNHTGRVITKSIVFYRLKFLPKTISLCYRPDIDLFRFGKQLCKYNNRSWLFK